MSEEHPRGVLNLDGVWNFATDPENQGEAAKWYQPGTALPAMPLPGYAPEANGTIRVPGTWSSQGYGTETKQLRHQFIGKGWYQRQVQIPQEWAGRRTFLVISGIMRYSKAWIDGQFLGEHIGYLSAQEYDITPYVTPGQTATLTIQVDSKQRYEIDPLFGASTYTDTGFSDMTWGGIWGHVLLESRTDGWLSDLFVQPTLADSSCSASAAINGKADVADAAKLEVFDKSGLRVAEAAVKLDSQHAAGQPVTIKAPLPGAALWTPDSPTLYTARLSLLQGGKVVDAMESRFGMREFTTDGPHILLNGKRIMLRGYGDDHVYPEQGAMPSDKELHLARLRTIKSYGFNHVRHHSTFMPPEYYDACDEIGMICAAEFPICYEPYIPGTGERWKANVPPNTDPQPALDTYHREWAAAIKRYRNHPSIMSWVMGNELYSDTPIRRSFLDIAQKLDPARFFSDSDGVDRALLMDPKLDRPTAAIYTILYEQSDPILNANKYVTNVKDPKPIKPIISHEAGNYVTFSRPDMIDQFQHNFKPFWLAPGKEKLDELGLLQEADQWAGKSERLYGLLHKYNLELLRKNPYISGYHWWLFQDYFTTSNGLVDIYFRPKSITAEETLKYNSAVVLLQEGLDRTYRGKGPFAINLLVSNFSPEPLDGELAYEVKSGDESLAAQQLPFKPVPQGDVAELAQIGFDLPDVSVPTKLTVTARVTAGGKRFTNDWTTWLYPSVIRRTEGEVPVFADETLIGQFGGWDVEPVPAEGELRSDAVYVVSWPCEPRVADAMKRGASVLVLGGANQLMKSYPVTFQTTWWKPGDDPAANHTGTLVYDHPATRAMAPDGWCDDSWILLIEGAQKCVFEGKHARPDVIIRALPSMARVEDQALLFEVGVGKGSLIVSGLNHRGAAARPENEWLVARLLEHAATFPQPKATWPADLLEVASVAPAHCLPGFRQLIANEGALGVRSLGSDSRRWFCLTPYL